MSKLRNRRTSGSVATDRGLTKSDVNELRTHLEATRTAHRQVMTNWIVITGAPGSGKTTLIAALHKRGANIVPDVAREVFVSLVEKGLSKRQARHNYLNLQQAILKRMLALAEPIDASAVAFFDYAIPDNLAFLKLRGLPWPQDFIAQACRYRYRHAFLLQGPASPADRDSDPVRIETMAERASLHKLIRGIYHALSIPITELPVSTVDRRVRAIRTAIPLRRRNDRVATAA
jgi:predicted ATPase